jgi:chromosome segregation ATPase
MARNVRKIAQLKQEILELEEENAREEEELATLQQTLEEWEERVASLKVVGPEPEVESFDPAEELTA